MRYNKQFDDTGKLIAIGTGAGGEEITKEEYDHLLSEIRAKAAHVDAVYADPLAIDKVPAEWRDEILRRVEERKQAEQEAEAADVTPEELEAARAAYEEGVQNA